MKRFLIILSLLISGHLFAQNMIPGIQNQESIVTLTNSSSFTTTSDSIKKLEARKIELFSTIKLEKERIIDEVKNRNETQQLLADIDVLLRESSQLTLKKNSLHSEELKDIEKSLLEKQAAASVKIMSLATKLDFGAYNADTSFLELQKDFPSLRRLAQNTLRAQDKIINDAEKKKNDLITEKNKELSEIENEINRLGQIRREQISQSVGQIGIYVAVFVFIYIAKFLSRRLLLRFGRDFSKSHQEALHLGHRWIFNILFVGAFLVLFSSEFVSFLPFIAIIGTAVGLALRDAIYSFIGWFVVGSDSGYQEDEFIEFDTTIGRVFRITPLLTTIEEYGSQGFTGKIISFPNKTIFEKNIKNWSRGSDFSLMSLDFLLTHKSDIKRAKELLMQVVGSRELSLYYSSRRDLKLLKSTYGYTDEDLKPQIHTVVEPRGTNLRVRILVHVKDRLSEQSRIMESFSTLVQKEENVEMRQV